MSSSAPQFPAPPSYPYRWAVQLVFAPARLRAECVEWTIAHNVHHDKGLHDRFAAGAYPSAGERADLEARLWREVGKLRAGLVWSGFWTALAFGAGVLVGFATGGLGLDRPVDVPKVTQGAGAYLAGWATVFALGKPGQTWKGKTPPEQIHPVVLRVLALAAIAVATAGTVMV